MKQKNVKKLVLSSIMVALAIVLSYIKILQLPFGGSVTLLSMLPICIISVKYGIGWGMGCGFCYSWFQIMQGGVFGWGLSPSVLIASLFLDFILAFTSVGLAGVFRKKGYIGYLLGTALACLLRFLYHFASGMILWANFDEFVAFGETFINRPVLYSFLYNGAYMLPELIFTVLGAALIFKVPYFVRLLSPED